jgi:hypothetical protein
MMMTMALEEAVGWQNRFSDDEHPRKRDRRATLQYGARQEVDRDGLSGAEFYAVHNGLFIGESLADSLGDGRPFGPGIHRLAMLTDSPFPEPVLVENSAKGSHSTLTLAVLAEYIGSHGGTMLLGPFRARSGPKPVTSRARKWWVQEAGLGHVLKCVEELNEVASRMLVEALPRDGIESITHLGTGFFRDYEIAGMAARERLEAGWTQKRVTDYLAVFGFVNSTGTVGRWNHPELKLLLSQS